MEIGQFAVFVDQEGRPTNGIVFATAEEGTVVSLIALHHDSSNHRFLTQGDFHLGLERIYSVKTVHRVATEAIQEENEKSEQYKRDAIPPTVEQLFPCVTTPEEVEIKDGVVIGFFIGTESLPALYKVPVPLPPPNPVPPAGTELVNSGGQVVGISDGEKIIPVPPPEAPASPSPEEANPAQVQAEPGTPATSTESGAQ